RLHIAIGQRTSGIDLLEPNAGLFQEFLVCRRIEWTFKKRKVAIDADKTLNLIAERRQIGGFRNGAVSGPLVFSGQTEIERLVAHSDAIDADEDAEQPVEVSADLGQKGGHVGGTERNARDSDHFSAGLLDPIRVRITC